jgi:CheY-like chemotaxis protein
MNAKLMAIDDQAELIQVVGVIAAQIGLGFRGVNDPTKALAEFLSFKPDMVLLDLVMPEKDGIDVLNELLATEISTAIILTSGFGDGMIRLAEGLARFHGRELFPVLKKPFRRSGLLYLLSRYAPALPAYATQSAGD